MIERKICPDCGGDLGRGAVKCRCGWKAQSDGAPTSADTVARAEEFKRREAERDQRAHLEAQEFMRAKGMKSGEDCVALARSTLRGIGSPADPLAHWRRVLANPNAGIRAHEIAREAIAKLEHHIDREPGSDDA